MTSLSGRRAIVTGASRGIGRAIALALAHDGADVAVAARHAADLDAVAEEIRNLGRRTLAAPCDVTQADEVARLAERVCSELGPPDVVVNNAGGAVSHKLAGHPDELWEQTIALNLTSVYRVTKAFLPALTASGHGRVINIASTAAKTAGRYTAAYTAAKHGLLGFTRVAALELAAAGVTVNAVCPGYTDTPMTAESIRRIVERTGRGPDDARRALEATNPQGRLIDPQEVAALVCFLATDAAAGITGQAINVDGGAVML